VNSISKDLKNEIIRLRKEGNNSQEIESMVKLKWGQELSWKQVAGILGANKKKWRDAYRKALKKAREAKTFTKYQLTNAGYRSISFDTKTGHEYKGVIDLVAIKRDAKEPDNLKILLFQVKGGSARVSDQEIGRLRKAKNKIKIGWYIAEKPANKVEFKKSRGPSKFSIEDIKLFGCRDAKRAGKFSEK
jgi:hypothetical protein